MARIQKTEQELHPLLEGLARIFDIRFNLAGNKHFDEGFEADVEALRGDWLAVGHDAEVAIKELGCQLEVK